MLVAMVAIPLLLLMAADPSWKLAWSDEFNTDGRPDPAKWTYEEGYIRNKEAQFYTRRPENVRVENGRLIIEARREGLADGFEYTSASLTTEGLAAWRHARVEVRAKLPQARGTWPAIWMLGANYRKAGWPRCGEIDILESVGFDPGVIHANIHTAKYNHVKKTGKGASTKVADLYHEFHVYAVEWDRRRMDFSVDGQVYFTFENEGSGEEAWPYDEPLYLILNIAVGGSWGGQKGIDAEAFPQRMEVDWVRVYQK